MCVCAVVSVHAEMQAEVGSSAVMLGAGHMHEYTILCAHTSIYCSLLHRVRI